jgi:hypothetical protein
MIDTGFKYTDGTPVLLNDIAECKYYRDDIEIWSVSGEVQTDGEDFIIDSMILQDYFVYTKIQ